MNGCVGVLELLSKKETINWGEIGDVLARCMGGSSGPILGSFMFGMNEKKNWQDGYLEGVNKMK